MGAVCNPNTAHQTALEAQPGTGTTANGVDPLSSLTHIYQIHRKEDYGTTLLFQALKDSAARYRIRKECRQLLCVSRLSRREHRGQKTQGGIKPGNAENPGSHDCSDLLNLSTITTTTSRGKRSTKTGSNSDYLHAL